MKVKKDLLSHYDHVRAYVKTKYVKLRSKAMIEHETKIIFVTYLMLEVLKLVNLQAKLYELQLANFCSLSKERTKNPDEPGLSAEELK